MATNLPSLPAIETLSENPRIVRILGGNPSKFTLQGTNTYLIGPPHSPTLIDTAHGLPLWRSSLASALPPNARITRTLLTHWHHDHVSGLPDLLTLPAASTTQIHKARPTYLGYGEHSLEGLVKQGKVKHETWRDIADGQEFEVGGGWSLRALRTPGHAVDHSCFLLVDGGAKVKGCFTGDNVLGHGTAVFEDLAGYMASLQKTLAALQEQQGVGDIPLYPAHGAVVPAGRAKVEEYIAHRAARERQVVETLRGVGEDQGKGKGVGEDQGRKGLSAMGIVRVVYKDYPEVYHLPALGGVEQVLRKLEGEGRVSRCEEREGEEVEETWRLQGEEGAVGRL